MSASKAWITSNSKPNTRSAPTAKRSPSILVTDVRSFPSKSPAPFAGGRSKSGPQALHSSKVPGRSSRKFHKVTMNHILSNISEIPSAQNRYPLYPDQTGQIQGQSVSSNHTNYGSTSLSGNYNPSTNSEIARSAAMNNSTSGSSKPSKTTMGNRMSIARLSQNIPTRTSKVSEKFVLIPDDIDPGFHFDDDDDFDAVPPTENDLLYLTESDGTRRSYAERLPKERRESKLPRVTAYYTGDGFRLQETSDFLRLNHHISPRIYDEALYAPYCLPLFPGENGCRIRSANSAKGSEGHSLLEFLMDRSEQSDYHFEYYSSIERDIDPSAPLVQTVESNNNMEFDPSEPQHFSPPRHMNPTIDQDTSESENGDTLGSSLSENEVRDGSKFDGEKNNTGKKNVNSDDDKTDILDINEPNGHNNSSNESISEIINDDNTENTSNASNEESEPMENMEVPDLSKHAEIFIFAYGVIVFWNFTESQEKDILADLTFARVPHTAKKASTVSTIHDSGGDYSDNEISSKRGLIIRPIQDQDIETEEFHFGYSPKTVRPRIYNDMITLRTANHMVKLAMSHSIAQSTKLCRFETRMDSTMNDVILVPRALALTGKLGMKREQIVRMSGKLFKIRVDVNLSSNVLDTPEIFWEDEPSLNPLYAAVREYLEIDQRILVLNERCKVFLELTDIISDSIAESNMSRITWIIIILITVSLLVSSVEIYLRFSLLTKPQEIKLLI
ncbi:DUF155-domain-containing protein [Nadsonia fulvescens var. elongata DSM 6958]|uniref:DUF155-domain-containing protein n=1 Tax=Nadsonia fulvescens var. elongata DSM 6958 TaxID=857566 RepID=A0A1E3PIS6_9ASCO|nr:DUF155-domain-containing protein [Nadsonia fulvescens var. elongata DSM 6958]